jgi:hypothetical protein
LAHKWHRMNLSPNFEERVLRLKRLKAVIVLLSVGLGFGWWNWHNLHATGEYWISLTLLSPAFIIFAVYFSIFRDDPSVMPNPIPLRLWVAYFASGVAMMANWYAVHHGLY